MATPDKEGGPEDTKISFKLRMLSLYLKVTDMLIFRKDGTVNRKVQNFFNSTASASEDARDGVLSRDVTIDAASGVWARVFCPSEEQAEGKKTPVILFYHGGGFVAFSADTKSYDELCRELARRCAAAVVLVNYRLAPEFPCPVAYDDCYKLFAWLPSEEGRGRLPATGDPAQCFLVGDSAGGNIAHFMACRAAENDIRPVELKGLVSLQPFFGGEELTPAERDLNPPVLPMSVALWAWRAFLPGESLDHPNINVFGPNAPDISDLPLPPMFVAIGSMDILKDRNTVYVEKLQAMGKDVTAVHYSGACHGFYTFMEELKEKCLADVVAFIRSRAR